MNLDSRPATLSVAAHFQSGLLFSNGLLLGVEGIMSEGVSPLWVCPIVLETKGLAVVPPSLGTLVRPLSLLTVEVGLSLGTVSVVAGRSR